MNQSMNRDYQSGVLVLGAGITGRSVSQYFEREFKNKKIFLLDENSQARPEGLSDPVEWIQRLTPEILSACHLVVASPGFDPNGLILKTCREANLKITSDLNLFAELAQAPIIAITGTNGKSTVTKMISEMLQMCGKKILTGGNFGVSPLDFLAPEIKTPDFYVLEISSAQMELAENLKPKVGVYLNLSPNHLDRHGDMATYASLKEKLLKQSEHAVILKNLKTQNLFSHAITFGEGGDFYLENLKGLEVLKYKNQNLILRSELANPEAHHVLNSLASLAVIKTLGLDILKACEVLKIYQPLPHRTERVGVHQQVKYINDSKATTIGATIQAIQSFRQEGEIILLLGGDGKAQDFTALKPIFDQDVLYAYLYGRDQKIIAEAVESPDKITQVETLQEAFELASQRAQPGQIVLLSPACASWDQFKNYAARGEFFKSLFLNLMRQNS